MAGDGPNKAGLAVPVGVSTRHIHLTAGDLSTLFGAGAALTVARWLRQPGQYAAAERVAVIGPAGSLTGVRVVGPTRSTTVCELAASDVLALGLSPGGAGETFPVTVAGTAGVVHLPTGGVIARRHLHISTAEAAAAGLRDGQVVAARLGRPGRELVLENVLVRAAPTMALELHIDADEANACGARTGDVAEILLAGAAEARRESGARRRRRRPLITEADVIAAHRRGTKPVLSDAILTPWAKEALRKYFPDLAEERL